MQTSRGLPILLTPVFLLSSSCVFNFGELHQSQMEQIRPLAESVSPDAVLALEVIAKAPDNEGTRAAFRCVNKFVQADQAAQAAIYWAMRGNQYELMPLHTILIRDKIGPCRRECQAPAIVDFPALNFTHSCSTGEFLSEWELKMLKALVGSKIRSMDEFAQKCQWLGIAEMAATCESFAEKTSLDREARSSALQGLHGRVSQWKAQLEGSLNYKEDPEVSSLEKRKRLLLSVSNANETRIHQLNEVAADACKPGSSLSSCDQVRSSAAGTHASKELTQMSIDEVNAELAQLRKKYGVLQSASCQPP